MQSTRRGFLKTGLAGVSAGAIGTGAVLADSGGMAAAASVVADSAVVPFYGTHQAGIATPAQNYLQFAAFDVQTDSVSELRKLLKDWTNAAAAMSTGKTIGPVNTGTRPPVDTGEGLGLSPAQLTVTFGFGPTLFTSNGKDRFGLAKHRPRPLVDLPAFAGDALQSAIGGGDLGVQVCANDPQVAFHAIHNLIRMAETIASARWVLAGFGRTGNSRHQSLPRNLMGFQDGTENIKVEDTFSMKNFVWASEPASPAWMRGGSYLVARRIQIALALWDDTGLEGQEQTIGREKVAGSLLAKIPPSSHIKLSRPASNGGQEILRRGYSFTDGIDSSGDTAVGLMFLCYQSDPRKQFIPIQHKLAGKDALNLYVTHIGSSVFACPPGAAKGGYVGEALLG
jgi:deferrochelatase/peroxidase EfeB